MIVPAFHPAPVVFVPNRARNPRFALHPCSTPVELREDALSRSTAVGIAIARNRDEGVLSEPMRQIDGKLWVPVAARRGASEFREAELAEFVAWLSGLGDPELDKAFDRQFSGTPLVAQSSDTNPNAGVMRRGPEVRADDVGLGNVREIRLDGRDKAAADVARYVAEEIRLLDGRPYMRCSPVLWVDGVDGTTKFQVESRTWPRDPGMRSLPATPDTVEATIDVQLARRVVPPNAAQEAERARWASLVTAGSLEGDDVRLVLARFAEPVRRSLDVALVTPGGTAARERLEAARRAMQPVEIASMTGTAHHDAETSLMAMREALSAWAARPGRPSHGQEWLLAFIDRVLVPRMDVRAAADLDGLSPRGP